MGAKCSSAGIIMPSKKNAGNNSSVPNSDRGKRNSLPDTRPFHSEQNTPRGVISAENTTAVTIKQRRVQTEADAGSQRLDTGSPLNETNNSKSTEIPKVRGIFQYKKGPLIGKGSYGEVYECLNLNTGELLAVKTFKVQGDLAKVLGYVETLKRDVVILQNLAHENIVKYYTTEISEVKDGDHVIVDIVQEYVSGGSVRKLLDKFNKLEERVVGTYVRQVLQGLHYLHMQGIYHRNIKGSNILIDTSGTIKLTEFGYSGKPDRFTEEGENKSKSAANKTPAYWSAPEIILKKSQGMPADIWSVGCVVIEMLTGSPPWTGQINNTEDFNKKMASGAIPNFPIETSDNCRDFLDQVFKPNPDERPTVIDLLEHPFMRDDDHLNASSYMEAESVVGGGISRTQTPANFLNLIDGRHSERPFNRTKTNTTGFKRQDSDVSSYEGNLRQDSGLSGYKDFMAGFKGNAVDAASAGGSATRQNSEDKNTLAMFKAYGFDNSSRQNSADKNHLVAFKAGSHDISRQNSEDKGQLAAFKAGAMDFRMKTEHTKNLANFVNNLRNVEEERDEEETTPHPNGTNLMRFNSAAKDGADPSQTKEDKRKELEEKMMRDLMRMNTGHLEEYGLTEEVEEDEGEPNENKTIANSPLKNKLVENIDSSKKKSIVSQFDFDQKEKKVMMITEMEMDDVKQKLRKEFEQQLESSLARINTEKLTHLIDREPKEAPAVERHTTVAARLIRDAMKADDSHVEEEKHQNPIWTQNIGEDLGSFRGFSENQNYGGEHKLQKLSSDLAMSDSDNNSPVKKRVGFKNQNSVIPEGEEATSLVNVNRQAEPVK